MKKSFQTYLLLIISTFIFINCGNKEIKNKSIDNNEQMPIQWVNYAGNKDVKKNKKIVLVSGDEEYRSEEALPQLAKILSTHHGFDCTVLFSQDPAKPGVVNPNYTNNIPGLNALENADLLILFTRFRALPDSQMQYFENYLLAGKPIIGIRTATHAFRFQDSLSHFRHWGNYYASENTEWSGGFGKFILGNNWFTHHGHHKHQSTRGVFAVEENFHSILNGIKDGTIWGATDVYGIPFPLPEDIQPIVLGQVVNRAGEYDEHDLFFGMKETDQEIAVENSASKNKYNPNDPMMPIVWEKPYELPNGKKGKSITSTIGASSDILNESLRRLFVNSTFYLLGLSVPENAHVGLVGNFNPTQFSFHDDEYWGERKINVSDFIAMPETNN